MLIVPTTRPEAIEQYSIRVVEQWKLGRKGVDDGALLLVAKDDRQLRIEVGRGLEGALTDLHSKRIIDEVIAPRFRASDFSGGIAAGADAIIKVVSGEPLPAPPARAPSGGGGSSGGGRISERWPSSGWCWRCFSGTSCERLSAACLPLVPCSGLAATAAWFLAGSAMAAAMVGVIAFLFVLFGACRS